MESDMAKLFAAVSFVLVCATIPARAIDIPIKDVEGVCHEYVNENAKDDGRYQRGQMTPFMYQHQMNTCTVYAQFHYNIARHKWHMLTPAEQQTCINNGEGAVTNGEASKFYMNLASCTETFAFRAKAAGQIKHEFRPY
jgi:hypothetical protein